MGNFVTEFKKGQEGKNIGISTGIPSLNKAINGIQQATYYAVGAAPKAGKTSLVDFCFVLSPYLEMCKNKNIELEWLYFSYEIDRVNKEFKFIPFFFKHDYNISEFIHKGKSYKICPNYIKGALTDDDTGEVITLCKEHVEIVKTIYKNRIIPLFGEYNSQGVKIKEGLINFIEDRSNSNPTGIRNTILRHAEKNGKLLKESYQTIENGVQVTKQKTVGYLANSPNKITIVVLDHIRNISIERGFTLKQNMDKVSNYFVELRNLLGISPVVISHINRNISSIERLKFNNEFIYPTSEDLKDSSALAEDANVVLTLFNPNDEKYNITKHFGLELKGKQGNEFYPNYRSLHLVESRSTECPQHLRLNMYGNSNYFEPLVENQINPYNQI